jgi:hypothetical protein
MAAAAAAAAARARARTHACTPAAGRGLGRILARMSLTSSQRPQNELDFVTAASPRPLGPVLPVSRQPPWQQYEPAMGNLQ